MRRGWRWGAGLVCAVACSVGVAWASEATQTDWCAGGGTTGPVSGWAQAFDTSQEIAWLGLPGQLALASDPLANPIQHTLASGLPVAFGVHPVDIDQDGDMDVLGAAGEAQKVLLWINDGQAPPGWTQQEVETAFAGAAGVHAADIDGDGDLDIVASAENPGNKLAWWRNDGGVPIVWTRQLLDNYFPVSCSVTTTDIDEDGRADVLATSWSLGDVTWWRNAGGEPVSWTEQTIDANFGGAHDAQAVDLDGDGDLDVIGAAGTHHRIAWWRNGGGQPIVWERLVIQEGFSGARAVHAADIDRDGRLDVVGVAWANHVTWWRNEGGDPIVWTRQDIDSAFNGGHCVWTGDVDGDGWTDVMATAYYDNTVAWWRNSGTTPITWEEHPLLVGWECPMNLRSGDLDGDGDLEILASSRELGEFVYCEATSFRAAGTLHSSILDLACTPEQAEIDWDLRRPNGTELRLRVRASDDPGQMGSWSDPLTEPGVLTLQMGRYVQYEVELSTTDPAISPVLGELRLLWQPSAEVSGDRSGLQEFDLRPVSPAMEQVEVRLSLPESGRASVNLYDVTGRRRATLADHVLAAGPHRFTLRGLAPGVYLCRLTAGERSLARRLIVVG